MPRKNPAYRTVGKKIVKLTFPTEDICPLFGLPEPDILDTIFELGIDSPALTDHPCLYIEQDEDDETGEMALWDKNDKRIPEEAVEELEQATVDAVGEGTLKRYWEEVVAALERCLETFSNADYEYAAQNDNGTYTSVRGHATGIVDVEIGQETTTITTNTDLVHLINQCIMGVGEVDVMDDYLAIGPYATVEDYIKDHFRWLGHHWEIFGASQPEVNSDDLDGFDKAYFLEIARDIEKRYDIRVISNR